MHVKYILTCEVYSNIYIYIYIYKYRFFSNPHVNPRHLASPQAKKEDGTPCPEPHEE